MILIVLAAGKGTRLPPKLRIKPKCMIQIKNKQIIEYNVNFFKKFKKKIIITGYKNSYIKKFIKKNNFIEIFNKKYSKTNMVYSMFLAKKYINKNVVVVYGDVVFSSKIYKLLKENKNIIPANENWQKNWISRMGIKKTLKDAESFKCHKNRLIEIGEAINKKENMPKLQYMGLLKITLKTFKILFSTFKALKDSNIDFTTFLNHSINKKKIYFDVKRYKGKWFEIDNKKDLKYAERYLK